MMLQNELASWQNLKLHLNCRSTEISAVLYIDSTQYLKEKKISLHLLFLVHTDLKALFSSTCRFDGLFHSFKMFCC